MTNFNETMKVKTMKKLKRSAVALSALIALLVAGCSTDGAQVEAAVRLCKDHGGVTEMDHDLGARNVTCMDGSYFQRIGRGN